jgi:excisionase family DNA binding protein
MPNAAKNRFAPDGQSIGVQPLLSVADLSKRLNCSERHIRRIVDSGALTPIRLGRILRFDAELIENWIQQGCPRAGSPHQPRRGTPSTSHPPRPPPPTRTLRKTIARTNQHKWCQWSLTENQQVTTSCSENDYRTNVTDAVRRADITELQYGILLMESAASPQALREAECRMHQADRDLVCVIGGKSDSLHSLLKGRNVK